MLFNSPVFLFLFLPLVLLINALLKTRESNCFLLFSSLAFYFYGEQFWTTILIASVIWNYFSGLSVEKVNPSYKKLILGISVTGNLALLIYFKYINFIMENIGVSSHYSDIETIILPLGISFFTFQGISYVVDVYRKEVIAERNLIHVGLYITYFPQLIAGPIIKYKEIHTFISKRKANQDDLFEGVFRFIRGLAKKVILADNFSLIADNIFAQAPSELSTSIAWLGVLTYTLQIYFDFSAYSDMAIALGRMMGFKIPENFNYPYIAHSIRNFWRRWHISLSTWFRDYLYIPLGGSKKANRRTYLNLVIVFFITGLWHGASWNFVAWGGIHGLFLIIERLKKNSSPIWLGRIYTLLIVSLSWVVFRCENLGDALLYYERLFVFKPLTYNEVLLFLNPYFIFLFILGISVATPIRSVFNQWMQKLLSDKTTSFQVIKVCIMLLLFVYTISEVTISNHHPFIYFKF